MDNKGYILKFGKIKHLQSLGAGKSFLIITFIHLRKLNCSVNLIN